MTVKEALANTPIKRADAEILLPHVLLKDRTWLLAHADHPLTDMQERTFSESARRRGRGEPVAYIRGLQEFYGKVFEVSSDVLIPRPSTEGLIDLALKAARGGVMREVVDLDEGIIGYADVWKEEKSALFIDIGTGSGCIAVMLAVLQKERGIGASDISADALRIAQSNAARHKVSARVELRRGRGLEPWADLQKPFLIVSNPPYIPAGEELMKDVLDFEPHEALFAGERGVDVLLPLVRDAREHPRCVGIVVECRKEQLEERTLTREMHNPL